MIILGLDPLSLRAGASLLVDDVLRGPRLGHLPERGRAAPGQEAVPPRTRMSAPGGASSSREELLALVAGLLEEYRLSIEQVDGVGLVTGPGSMTGIRIGVATVQGLLFGRLTPVVAVSTLDAIAREAPDALPAIQLRRTDWFVRHGDASRLMSVAEMDSLGPGFTLASSGNLPPLERVATRFLGDGLSAVAARMAFDEISAGRGLPPDKLEAAYHADTYVA